VGKIQMGNSQKRNLNGVEKDYSEKVKFNYSFIRLTKIKRPVATLVLESMQGNERLYLAGESENC
jgi:hypothetical protein